MINAKLQQETGYTRMENGYYLVSIVCPMPDLTREMIEWWFWWHPQEDARYQLWYPGEYYGIGYAKKNIEYFQQQVPPEFKSNIQYPLERIGNRKMPQVIEFFTPEDFGFSKELIEQSQIVAIVWTRWCL